MRLGLRSPRLVTAAAPDARARPRKTVRARTPKRELIRPFSTLRPQDARAGRQRAGFRGATGARRAGRAASGPLLRLAALDRRDELRAGGAARRLALVRRLQQGRAVEEPIGDRRVGHEDRLAAVLRRHRRLELVLDERDVVAGTAGVEGGARAAGEEGG